VVGFGGGVWLGWAAALSTLGLLGGVCWGFCVRVCVSFRLGLASVRGFVWFLVLVGWWWGCMCFVIVGGGGVYCFVLVVFSCLAFVWGAGLSL